MINVTGSCGKSEPADSVRLSEDRRKHRLQAAAANQQLLSRLCRPMYYCRMSELHVLSSHKSHQELVLAGFRLDGEHDGPQFYTLLAVGGENERPIMSSDRLLFFTRPELGVKALALDTELAKLAPPPMEVETFCDVAEALHLVNSQALDSDAVVLDCLLMFDDLVRATRLHMPDRYQGLLTELTARLTEGKQLGNIFTSHFLREHVEDALLWCIGAIAAKSRMIAE